MVVLTDLDRYNLLSFGLVTFLPIPLHSVMLVQGPSVISLLKKLNAASLRVMTELYKIVEIIRQLLDIDDKKDHENIHLMLSIFHALDK